MDTNSDHDPAPLPVIYNEAGRAMFGERKRKAAETAQRSLATRAESWRKPYPVDALGEVAGNAVRAIAHNIQCPPALAANSILACASVAAQAIANVQLGHGGRPRPLSLHVFTAAESGERKSSADDEATTALHERQGELAKEYAVAYGEYRAKVKAWTAEEARITKTKNYAEREKLLIAHGRVAPIKPPGSMLVFDKGTVQGISKAFLTQQPALGLLNNDAGSFVGGHSFKDENAVETGATLSKFWDGQGMDTLLSGDGHIRVQDKRLAIHGMIQPQIARDFLCDDGLTDQGYIARCLIAWPESKIGHRPELHPDTAFGIAHDEAGDPTQHVTVASLRRALKADIKVYGDRLAALLKASRVQPDQGIDFRLLTLSAPADDLRREFANDIEAACRKGGKYHPVKASAAKTAEQAHRIAGILQLLADPESFKTPEGALCGPMAREISVDLLESGATLARWYLDEILRIREMAERTEADISRALLAWVVGRPEDLTGGWSVPMRDLQGGGPRCLRVNAFGGDLRRAREARIAAVETLISVGAAEWRSVSGEKKLSFFVPRGATL